MAQDSFDQRVEVLLQYVDPLTRFIEKRIPARFRGQFSADDVLQDVWVSIVRSKTDWTCVQSVEAWLYAIARRRLEDACRLARAKKRGGDVIPIQTGRSEALYAAIMDVPQSATHTPSQYVMTLEVQTRIADALHELDPRTRDAIELHYRNGLTRSDVAERMDLPESTVNSVIFRGLKRLRELLPNRTSRRWGA